MNSRPSEVHKVLVSVFLVAWIGFLTYASIGCSKPLTAQEEQGKYLYDLHCAQCHDANALGLKKEPPKLNGLFSHSKMPDGDTPVTDAQVRTIIIQGKRTMPAFNGRLNDDDLSALIAYLHRK